MLLENGPYLSAATCAKCHPGHYEEWTSSPHAYAQISPVFNAMHGTILKLTNATNGDFCIRCHTPIGMELNEPLLVPNAKRNPVSREGITCVVCHRVKVPYGKISGRFRMNYAGDQGDIFDPVYGPGLTDLTEARESRKFAFSKGEKAKLRRRRAIHGEVREAEHLTQSSFCGVCHNVTLMNGFRLEEAFSEFKTSPAAAKGQSCQDCHMGYDPGKPNSYRNEPIAEVTGVEFPQRKRTNHRFIGPDYSIVHPGIYPHDPRTLSGDESYPVPEDDVAAIGLTDWLTFDWQGDWGKREFEKKERKRKGDDRTNFPVEWQDRKKRELARKIIDDNLKRLETAQVERKKLLALGYQLGEIQTLRADKNGIRFRIAVSNGTDGHGVPTGFDAERLVFLRVTVTDAQGEVVFRSGDLDPNGDLRDLHSIYVHNHAKDPNTGEYVELDEQLFSLQSKFVTRNVRGGEREQVLAVNTSLSALRFLRPSTFSTVLTGRPAGVRKHKQNIAPHDKRWASYTMRGEELTGHGPYTARVELVAGMVPVNLIDAIQHVGFDYDLSPREVAHRVVHGIGGPDAKIRYGGHTVLHTRERTFNDFAE